MIFKRVCSSIVATSFLFTGAAFASDGISVKYNNTGMFMEIDGVVGSNANALVSVAVYEESDNIDFSNPLLFSSDYTGENGKVDFDIKTTDSFESGRYVIYLSTKDAKAQGVLNYVSKEGLKVAMDAINGVEKAEDIAGIIKSSKKNLGVDNLVSDFAIDTAAAILASQKNADYTDTDAFYESFNTYLAYAYLNEEADTYATLKEYEEELGVKVETLEQLDERTFKMLLEGIKNADFTQGLLPEQLPELTFVAEMLKSETWSELKYVILGIDENGNKINNNFNILNPDTEYYSKVEKVNNVYKEMFENIGNKKTVAEFRKLFEDISETVYYDETDSGTSGGGGGGGSSSSGGKSKVAVSPYAPVEIVTPQSPSGESTLFTDIGSHWAKAEIEALSNKGVISGYPDGSFMPDKSVTRAEFVKLITLAFELPEADSVLDFNDVDNASWYKKYVDAAVSAGLIAGVGNGMFNPDGVLTREDASLILYRYLGLIGEPEVSVNKFADDNEISDYAKDAIYALSESGIINGMENGEFEPKSELTRAQACKLLNSIDSYLVSSGK